MYFDPDNDEYDRGFEHARQIYKEDMETEIQQLKSIIERLRAELRLNKKGIEMNELNEMVEEDVAGTEPSTKTQEDGTLPFEVEEEVKVVSDPTKATT